MQSINEIIKIPEKKQLSQRSLIIKELYELYILDETGRKKENWKRYVKWLKENKIPNSKENQMKFKKSKKFVKVLKINQFCYFLSHLKEKDLFYLLSVAKDKMHRKENYGAFILGSLMCK